jgi:hypothetical protein
MTMCRNLSKRHATGETGGKPWKIFIEAAMHPLPGK